MAKELCKRVKENEQLTDAKKYLSKVLPPSHYCLKCGRAAADDKYLCKPKGIRG